MDLLEFVTVVTATASFVDVNVVACTYRSIESAASHKES